MDPGAGTTAASDARALARTRAFLLGAGLLFLLVFALPLLIAPYDWASWFGWDTHPRTALGVYFGRCLGAVATAVSVQALLLSRRPARSGPLFPVLCLAAVLLAVVHVVGALDDVQPLVEDVEALGYAGFAALAWACRPRQ